MSRLTDEATYCLMRCADDFDSFGEECKLYKVCFERKMYDKLKHYEDLEEAGRLITLPCKVDEWVWEAHPLYPTHETKFFCNGDIVRSMEAGYCIGYTKAEAEAKLEVLKGGAE